MTHGARAWGRPGAVTIVVVSSVLTAFSLTLGQLQVLRMVLGIGTEPVRVAMVGEWWQKENRGFAVGTLLIGAVVAAYAWRQAFLFIPLMALPIVLARRENLRRVNAWNILIGRGVFRNPPFPVMSASIIGAVPEGGSSDVAPVPVAGIFIQNLGFAVHHVSISAVCLLALIPVAMIRKTAAPAQE